MQGLGLRDRNERVEGGEGLLKDFGHLLYYLKPFPWLLGLGIRS